MEKVWSFLKKTKNRTTIEPAIPLLGIYPKKKKKRPKKQKTLIQKDKRSPVFTEALCTVVKTWKQSNSSSQINR